MFLNTMFGYVIRAGRMNVNNQLAENRSFVDTKDGSVQKIQYQTLHHGAHREHRDFDKGFSVRSVISVVKSKEKSNGKENDRPPRPTHTSITAKGFE
jgi:hypothetical protein